MKTITSQLFEVLDTSRLLAVSQLHEIRLAAGAVAESVLRVRRVLEDNFVTIQGTKLIAIEPAGHLNGSVVHVALEFDDQLSGAAHDAFERLFAGADYSSQGISVSFTGRICYVFVDTDIIRGHGVLPQIGWGKQYIECIRVIEKILLPSLNQIEDILKSFTGQVADIRIVESTFTGFDTSKSRPIASIVLEIGQASNMTPDMIDSQQLLVEALRRINHITLVYVPYRLTSIIISVA